MSVKSRFSKYVELEGTRNNPPEATFAGATNPNDLIEVTITLSWLQSVDEALKKGLRVTRDEFELQFVVPPERYQLVEEFALFNNMCVIETNKMRRSITLRAKVTDIERAFRVVLLNYQDNRGNIFYAREGQINVPVELVDITEGIMGLDNRPTSRTSTISLSNSSSCRKNSKGYTPVEVAEAYCFPKGADGLGECIGIIELGGGYKKEDMDTYFSALSLKVPDISWISVNRAFNAPTRPESYDKEVAMNIQVAGAIAPGAKIIVYFAPNTEKGFFDAIATAIHDNVNRPSVISISWGAPEMSFTPRSLASYNEAFKIAALLGVTICAAAGNLGVRNGMTDGRYHVDFPASSPYVLSCGGTTLLINNGIIVSETAWEESEEWGSGGGISEYFLRPGYQDQTNIPLSKNISAFCGRGLPDVAANANPQTGYKVFVHGSYMIVGGTSSVAPLYAGLITLCNQMQGTKYGFLNPALYAGKYKYRNIHRGTSIPGFRPIYKPAIHWNTCTGFGVLSSL